MSTESFLLCCASDTNLADDTKRETRRRGSAGLAKISKQRERILFEVVGDEDQDDAATEVEDTRQDDGHDYYDPLKESIVHAGLRVTKLQL